jgi:hypothetical protein
MEIPITPKILGYEGERLRALAGRLNDPAKKMRPSNLSQETQRMLRV